MELMIGIALAIAVGAFADASGFARSRAYYPTMLIVIATYYCLFAAMAGSGEALLEEAAIAGLFTLAAVAGFHRSAWIVVAALAGHGAMDAFHHHLVANAGVPAWWPGFCAAFDIAIALWLAVTLVLRCKAGSDQPKVAVTR